MIVPAFSSLRHHENEKQIDILGIVYVLTIQGFVLLLLLFSDIFNFLFRLQMHRSKKKKEKEKWQQRKKVQSAIPCLDQE